MDAASQERKAGKMKKLLLPFISLFFLCGCWNYTDTNHRLIVTGAAIDLGENGETIVTAEIMSFEKSGDTQSQGHLLVGTGRSISEALNDMLKKSGKELYWQHGTILILGAEYAQNGVSELLDYILNDHEMRMTMDFAVSGMEKGADVFDLDTGDRNIVSYAITSRIYEGEMLGNCVRQLAYQAIDTYAKNMRDYVMPLVLSGENGMLEVSGCAVFHGQKMVGTINAVESQYVHMLDNTLKAIELQIETQEMKSSVSLGGLSTKVKMTYQNQRLLAKISLDGYYEVLMSVEDPPMQRDARFEKICELSKIQLEEGLQATNEHLARIKCDLFGWGERLFRYDPDAYEELTDVGVFETVPKIEISITLQSRIEGIAGTTVDQEGA